MGTAAWYGSVYGKGKHLGLHYLIGRSKKEIFSFVRDRASKKTKEVEGEVSVSCRKGDFDQVSALVYTDLCDVYIFNA